MRLLFTLHADTYMRFISAGGIHAAIVALLQ